MKPLLCLLSAPLLALALFGCGTAVAANPDLVVYNDSTQVIYTITLSTETQSESVSSPRDLGLLERGDRYGMSLDGQSGPFTLELLGKGGELLGRWTGEFDGERLYLTLWEDGAVTASKEG